MNVGEAIGYMLAVVFLLLSIVFALTKEKGANLLSGFNTMPKWKRENYDKARISKDTRNKTFIWFLLFLVAGILSRLVSKYIGVVVLIFWLIMFFATEVKWDTEKVFGKYKIKD